MNRRWFNEDNIPPLPLIWDCHFYCSILNCKDLHLQEWLDCNLIHMPFQFVCQIFQFSPLVQILYCHHRGSTHDRILQQLLVYSFLLRCEPKNHFTSPCLKTIFLLSKHTIFPSGQNCSLFKKIKCSPTQNGRENCEFCPTFITLKLLLFLA